MKSSAGALLAIGLLLVAIPASAQHRGSQPRPPVAPPPMKTANEAYWDTVRATLGPIQFPQATPADEFSRRFRMRSRGFGPAIFESGTYFWPPEPVYVPVYVPGPLVYVPLPDAAPPPAPARDSASDAAAPHRPEKFYVIVGCYAGNKPPQPDALPAGCDIQKLRVNTW